MVMRHDLYSRISRNSASLIDILRYRSLQQASQIALSFLNDGHLASQSLTYKQLDLKARAIAGYLQSLDATNERVLLLYPPGLEFVSAFFGCLYAGAIAVPMYPPRGKQRLPRLRAIARDAQATFALTTKSVMTNLAQSFKEEPLVTLQCIVTDDLTYDADKWFLPEITQNSLAFLQYTSGSTGTPKGVMVSHSNVLHNLALIDKCFEHTADSKGVIWLPPYHDMGLIGGVLLPIYGGYPITLMSPETFLMNPFLWLKAISDCKATTSGGPNFAYDLCVDKITPEQRTHLDLSSWEVAFNGAEPVSAETIERFSATFADCGFKRSAFYPCYGMAEATLIMSGGLKKDPPVIRYVERTGLKQNQVVSATSNEQSAKAIVGVGRSWLDRKIVIADPESLTKCPDEQIGEIWVCGSGVTGGYWRRPQETQQTFDANLVDTGEGPFLRTGDLGFLLCGELFVTGRIKDVIIIRGQNHYPQDIELTVQNSHSALRSNCGAAFSVEVEAVERLVIVQEVERSYLRQLDVDEVIKAIRQAVSEQHQLEIYAVLLLKTATIPKTSSGKIQRHACRAGFLDGSLNVVGWTANSQQTDLLQIPAEVKDTSKQVQTSAEQQPSLDENESETNQKSLKRVFTKEEIQSKLVSELALYLRVSPDEIDIQESLTAYGLNSLVALDITDKLSKWTGCELEPTLLWEYPNIKMLTQYLAEKCQ